MRSAPMKNALVGMVTREKDLRTAQKHGWYRIPVKSAPEVVHSGALETLALYQTRVFADEKYSVRWWGTVSGITQKKRIELLPDEPANPNANEEYYVISMTTMRQFSKPIVSPIPRRNPFITTTTERLFAARDYNDLFCGSPIEEELWTAFRNAGIPVQRELMVSKTVGRIHRR